MKFLFFEKHFITFIAWGKECTLATAHTERTTCRNLFSSTLGPRDQIQVPTESGYQVLIQMHEAAAWGGLSLSLRQALWGLDQDAELFPDCLRQSERSAV